MILQIDQTALHVLGDIASIATHANAVLDLHDLRDPALVSTPSFRPRTGVPRFRSPIGEPGLRQFCFRSFGEVLLMSGLRPHRARECPSCNTWNFPGNGRLNSPKTLRAC